MKISALLKQDHVKIEGAIDALNHVPADRLPDALAALRELVQRHMFVEELAVFTYLRIENGIDFSGMATLQRQHDDILEHFDQLFPVPQPQRPPATVDDVRMRALLQALDEHHRYEDKTLYARLDADLSEQQKRKVLMRLQVCVE